MYILAASSLSHALETLPLTAQKRTSGTCLAIPSLSLKYNVVNQQKTDYSKQFKNLLI